MQKAEHIFVQWDEFLNTFKRSFIMNFKTSKITSKSSFIFTTLIMDSKPVKRYHLELFFFGYN